MTESPTATALNNALETTAMRAIKFHEDVAAYHNDEAKKLRAQLRILREKRGTFLDHWIAIGPGALPRTVVTRRSRPRFETA